jgi:DNA-binding transcriptional MerR regulator
MAMMIGELAEHTGLSVRTLRFYANVGVLPETARTEAGYRLFGPDAVARGRLIRTLRELGVGLDDVRRVLAAEASLADVAAVHAQAVGAQIETLRLQRAVLRAVAKATDLRELEQMADSCGSRSVDLCPIQIATVPHVLELGAQLIEVVGVSHEGLDGRPSRSSRTTSSRCVTSRPARWSRANADCSADVPMARSYASASRACSIIARPRSAACASWESLILVIISSS